MRLEELENMESGSSEEYDEGEYPERRRYFKRSPQMGEVAVSRRVVNENGERRVEPVPVERINKNFKPPLAKPLRSVSAHLDDNVAQVSKVVDDHQTDTSAVLGSETKKTSISVEDRVFSGCFIPRYDRFVVKFSCLKFKKLQFFDFFLLTFWLWLYDNWSSAKKISVYKKNTKK